MQLAILYLLLEVEYMKLKIIALVLILIGAAVGYKFYNDKVEAETTKTYETEKVVRMNLTKTVSAISKSEQDKL